MAQPSLNSGATGKPSGLIHGVQVIRNDPNGQPYGMLQKNPARRAGKARSSSGSTLKNKPTQHKIAIKNQVRPGYYGFILLNSGLLHSAFAWVAMVNIPDYMGFPDMTLKLLLTWGILQAVVGAVLLSPLMKRIPHHVRHLDMVPLPLVLLLCLLSTFGTYWFSSETMKEPEVLREIYYTP